MKRLMIVTAAAALLASAAMARAEMRPGKEQVRGPLVVVVKKPKPKKCSKCGGTGFTTGKCGRCGGTGTSHGKKCRTCAGTGTTEKLCSCGGR